MAQFLIELLHKRSVSRDSLVGALIVKDEAHIEHELITSIFVVADMLGISHEAKPERRYGN